MALIKTKQEIIDLKQGGKILAEILKILGQNAVPGISTKELDDMARDLMKQKNVKPSFLNFQGFPAAICTSVNEYLVHGIPNNYKLRQGDIISIDGGVWYNNLCTDMAYTVAVGDVSSEAIKLMKVTRESLNRGLIKIKAGNNLGDFGEAVQSYVEGNGFSVIRDLVGHGVGHAVHEDPHIPNFGKKGTGMILQPGMVIALEPMVAMGDYQIQTSDDGWTIVMKDKSLSAHYEVTVVVTESGFEFITPKIW